jgi:ribosome biogenesis GTPase
MSGAFSPAGLTGLAAYGWTPAWAEAFAALPGAGLSPARVILEHGRFLRLHDGERESLGVATGRLRHEAGSGAELPTVGDWVAVAAAEGGMGSGEGGKGKAEKLASIHHVLPRKSCFSRRRAGLRAVEQVVAANVDTVFLLMGLDADFNPRRLERYLAVAFASGAQPVVVMNKADLVADAQLEAQRALVAAVAGAAPVIATNLRDPAGHQAVVERLVPGQTVALLGSSGVGKSTLLNRLAGADLQRTADVRESDGRGRHTTTYAQLFPLPGGALAIDTPGMRELQLWDADQGLGTAFSDIEEVAAHCRFRDCHHADEPGCAVRAALAAGSLSSDRYDSFKKLQAELEQSRDARGRRKR